MNDYGGSMQAARDGQHTRAVLDRRGEIREEDGRIVIVTRAAKTLTVAQAAQWLHANGVTDAIVHVETVRTWCRSGRLPATKDRSKRGRGGEWMIDLEDLAAFRPPTERGRRARPRKPRCRQCRQRIARDGGLCRLCKEMEESDD